jgi:uncharacterized membrane protein
MAAVYEDNFGFWDIDGQEEQAFFEDVRRQSVQKTCDRCERPARLIPSKTTVRILRHCARMRRACFNERVLTWRTAIKGTTSRSVVNTLFATLALCALGAAQAASDDKPIPVTPDNFVRAESDLYFSGVVKDGGFGKFMHRREPTPIAKQTVIRMNRDTLYSAAVFDLDAGPVTITLPDSGKRFLSMQVIDEDEYSPEVVYGAVVRTLKREEIGTRYVIVAVRILVDPNDPKDVEAVHALQDAIQISQPGGPGTFKIPNWDASSQVKVREGLLSLASTIPDTKGMFGPKDKVDPVRHLIGSAAAWGGNPEQDALYLNVTPAHNDGKTIYKLDVKNVPVDGFWSISVYDDKGYFVANAQNAYSLNNVTAKPSDDGSVAMQFGGCDGKIPNCLPTPPGWNYLVRLYRPKPEVLTGAWTFPEPQAAR